MYAYVLLSTSLLLTRFHRPFSLYSWPYVFVSPFNLSFLFFSFSCIYYFKTRDMGSVTKLVEPTGMRI